MLGTTYLHEQHSLSGLQRNLHDLLLYDGDMEYSMGGMLGPASDRKSLASQNNLCSLSAWSSGILRDIKLIEHALAILEATMISQLLSNITHVV